MAERTRERSEGRARARDTSSGQLQEEHREIGAGRH